MEHEPALEAQEHAEHAEHAAHARDPFISRVTITIAALAVLAATAGSLETVESSSAITQSSEAVLAQNKAADAWNEYQADSLKRHMYEIAADNAGPKAAVYGSTAKDNADKQAAVQKIAMADERERDSLMRDSATHETRHHWLTGAATLIEIGIALSTVAIITRRKSFWLGAVGLGAIGTVLLLAAYGQQLIGNG